MAPASMPRRRGGSKLTCGFSSRVRHAALMLLGARPMRTKLPRPAIGRLHVICVPRPGLFTLLFRCVPTRWNPNHRSRHRNSRWRTSRFPLARGSPAPTAGRRPPVSRDGNPTRVAAAQPSPKSCSSAVISGRATTKPNGKSNAVVRRPHFRRSIRHELSLTMISITTCFAAMRSCPTRKRTKRPSPSSARTRSSSSAVPTPDSVKIRSSSLRSVAVSGSLR